MRPRELLADKYFIDLMYVNGNKNLVSPTKHFNMELSIDGFICALK